MSRLFSLYSALQLIVIVLRRLDDVVENSAVSPRISDAQAEHPSAHHISAF